MSFDMPVPVSYTRAAPIIVVGKPPVYARCAALFDIDGKPILFAWGDKIYNPMDIDIPKELIAHERVHGERQTSDPAKIMRWWDRYLADDAFRFEEERVAHRAEWLYYAKRNPGKNTRPVLDAIAGRLAGALYGSLTTISAARDAILRP